MVERISQSMITTMQSYLAEEECGNIVEYQYVQGKLVNYESKQMALGSYFEFILTGALPKSGRIPRPRYMKSAVKKFAAKDLKVEHMTVDYRRAHFNAEQVMGFFLLMGLEVVKSGQRVTKGRFEGTIDIIAKCTRNITFDSGCKWVEGELIVIDVKYSGLLYNKWEKLGWAWSDIQKEYHGKQAIQYHFLTGFKFHFLVISNTNEQITDEEEDDDFELPDIKFFYTPIDQHMVDKHLALGNTMHDQLKHHSELGFIPRPSYKKCSKCPLKDNCNDKHLFPHVEEVDLTLGI
jgi:hypothetical protein